MAKKRWILFFLLPLFPIFLSAQENTALSCADGIDNDGDGFIDCLDNDCMNLANNGCQICSDGISFADALISYTPGCAIVDPFPEGALGVSDWNGQTSDVPEFVFLGQGGSIKLAFTNNYVTNSGDSQLDLWVFEVGPAVESSDLALRPSDIFTTTQLNNLGIPDSNGDGFYEIGNIAGSTSGLDLDNIMPGYPNGALKFDAIEIMDFPDFPCGSATPGADIDAVCALSFVVVDCAGTVNGTAVIDECGECLEPNDPNFNQSCADCAGMPNGLAVIDDCGDCFEPNDPNYNQSCSDCAGTPNGLAVIDACGECLEPSDPNFNQSCLDCAGAINGTAIIDDCGECLQPNDPNFNQSCADCAGMPNGLAVIDDCGDCFEPSDPAFNQACSDCAGVANGPAIVDECGACLEPNDPDFNQTCLDCSGAINGSAVVDDCGDCMQPNDPNFNQACADCAGVANGIAIIDQCGECHEANAPEYNQSCADCNGTPNGTALLNDCAECLEVTNEYYNVPCAEKYKIYIPNAFSPNGDGSNERFQVQAGEGIVTEVLNYQIFDRWGELLYEQKGFLMEDTSKWWNGNFKKQTMSPAVFVYKIEILFGNNEQQIFSGDFVLLK